ncbi:phosphotransferase [Nonomuraea dietziae]|uniref:phosphotransferase n=1 Tax=Nonomuraea dietziae TaxID=65515 RepID=UPI0033ED3014
MLSLGEKPVTDREDTAVPHAGDGVTSALLAALRSDPPPPFSLRRYLPLPDGPGPGEPAWEERGIDVDQTNHSVVVGDRVVVKWMAVPAPLPHPTLVAFAHLTEAGFEHTAPPYAALTVVDSSGAERLLALVTGYLPEARDGWKWCVDEAEAGRTAFAATLGRLAADLHLALATFPAAGAQAPPASSLAVRAERALEEALRLTDGEDGAWLREHADALRARMEPLAGAFGGATIRIHGDFHVGQILRWRDGYAVIDFDGNPTVAEAEPYQPAARDVAQLTTSLEHVAQVAIKRRGTAPSAAATWAATAREALLSAYRERLRDEGRPELLDERLIGPFEIEQECRELIYAARHLPRWRYAPMGVLRTRFTEETP